MTAWQSFAVLPAAGRSLRMGRPKLLLPWQGGMLIERVVAAWKGSHVTRLVVVARRDDHDLVRLCRQGGAEVVAVDPPPAEMRISVQLGLEFIRQTWQPSGTDVWLLAPADMPTLSSAVINQVLAAHRPDEPVVIVPVHAGRRGHPVLFPWQLAAEVAGLPAGEGLRQLVQRFPPRLIPVAEPAVLEDVDTPQDYQRLSGTPPQA